MAQESRENTINVKTRYRIQTVYDPNGDKHIDTIRFEAFDKNGKWTNGREYKYNKVDSYWISAMDANGRTISLTNQTVDHVIQKQDNFYDAHGNVVKSIKRNFSKMPNGDTKEITPPDTSIQVFDKNNNRISVKTRLGSITWKYDNDGHIMEWNSYQGKTGKPQRNVNFYSGDLLVETQSYWYDGKLYHRISYQYNEKKQLIKKRDSTTNFFESTSFTYNKAGLKASDTINKISFGNRSQTVSEFTYDQNGYLSKLAYHSNDKHLLPFIVLPYHPKNSDYILKETCTYDQYGNQLSITSELNGTVQKVVDFKMTYYQ